MPATSCSGDRFLRRSSKRPRRLAFEIDDDKVAAGEKDLAEMVVAVDAGDHGRTLEPGEKLKAAAGKFFKLEYSVRLLPGVVQAFHL